MTDSASGGEHPDQARASVFGQVDQESVISRLDQASEDEAETTFFDAALRRAHPDAERVFRTGVQVMGGMAPAATPGSEVATEPGIGGSLRPVAYVGAIADDPRARRAFILHGPAGVLRQA